MSPKKNTPSETAAEPSTAGVHHQLETSQGEINAQNRIHELVGQNEILVQSLAEMQTVLRQYTELYDFAPIGYFTLSRNGTILQVNLSGAHLLNLERQELVGQLFGLFVSLESYPVFVSFLEKILDGHGEETCEIVLLKHGHEQIWVRIEATYSDTLPEQGGICHLVVSDITEHKRAENILQVRLRITEFAAEHSLGDLLQNALDELCALTDSPIGFFHFVEPDQRTLSLQAWSTRTLKEMCTAEGKGRHYDIGQAGVWVDCVREGRPVIHNDYPSLPASRRKGLPEGHAPITREMVFPIIRNQKITAIIGVGNKLLNYSEDDAAHTSRLADLIWDITERKRAEEALRESEARYRSILEDQTELICRYLPDGRLSYVNEAYARYYGETAQKLINTNFIPNIPEPDISMVIGKIAEITPQESVVVYEHRIIKSDGEIRWQRWTHRGIYNAAGSLIEHQAVGRDITERKQMESALATERRRLADILKGTNAGTWEWNVQTGETIFNERWAGIVGYILDELSPVSIETWKYLVHPDDLKRSSELLERHFKGELAYYEAEVRMRHKNGHWVWVFDRGKVATWTDDGKPLLISGTHQDITERKRAEEEMNRYLSELKVLYDNGLAISALREPREIGRKIIETLASNLSWHHIAIRLRRGGTDDLELIAFNQPSLGGQESAEVEERLRTLVSKVGQGLVGWSVETGQAIRSGNVQEHPRYVNAYSGIRSGMYMPLTVGEQVIGGIAVESEEENAFTEQDERLLTTLAAQTAITFENARLYQNLQQELQERQRAELALAKEKEFTETVLDSQRDTFFVLEPVSGKAIRWNRIFRDITGYTHEEIASLKAPDSYYSPKDLKKVAAVIETILLKGSGRVELSLICKDGRRIPTEYEASLVQDQTGEINYIIAVGRDITERKQAEEQIQFLAKFPAEDPKPVLRITRDGTLLYINEAGLNLLSQWNLQVGEVAPPMLRQAVFQSMQNKKTQTFDLEHSDRLYAFYVAPIISSGYANLYGHDITESRQARALRDAETRYHVLFEQSPYGVLLVDPETGDTIEANDITSRQLGYTRDEFSALKISDYEATEDPNQIAQHMQKIILEGSDDFETLHCTKTGELRNVHTWVKTLQVNDRVLFYTIFQDITERKQMEEANETYSREITLLEERQRIASDLHDAVSQTLFSARLNAETLLRQPDRQSDSFTHSLTDLNRLVRSASGEIRLILFELRNNALLNVNLNTLLTNLIDSGMARTNANIVFQCYVDDLILPAQLKLAFYRIAQEAINNAIKHGKPGNIHCILRDDERILEMTIQDDGTGFAIDTVSDDHFGLQIMNERAEQAGVELAITALPGSGTSITVIWKKERL